MKPLVIPAAAQRDEHSIQILGAWIAEHEQHCSIKIGFWQDNGHDEQHAWGVFLADTIRHIANGLQEKYGTPATDTVATILDSLHDELDTQTSNVRGAFSPGHG